MSKPYDDIPGTYVMDGAHSRRGYKLNMFCMSLNSEDNRETFRQDESIYIDGFGLTAEQKQAVLDRDYLELLRLGGNIYYTFKLAIFDRNSMQFVGGQMSGISEEAFKQMMLDGGRPIEGNRYKEGN
ncbi:MAG: protocatechuate 4,5-dioxygenase alpha chain [Limisphaerales bacterium]|jgi:protocatechuate 4,5-dioxygenase alpha chain